MLLASDRLKDCYEFVLTAVRTDGQALRMASPRLRNCHDIVAVAVKQSEAALRYASKRLRNDPMLRQLEASHEHYGMVCVVDD